MVKFSAWLTGPSTSFIPAPVDGRIGFAFHFFAPRLLEACTSMYAKDRFEIMVTTQILHASQPQLHYLKLHQTIKGMLFLVEGGDCHNILSKVYSEVENPLLLVSHIAKSSAVLSKLCALFRTRLLIVLIFCYVPDRGSETLANYTRRLRFKTHQRYRLKRTSRRRSRAYVEL